MKSRIKYIFSLIYVLIALTISGFFGCFTGVFGSVNYVLKSNVGLSDQTQKLIHSIFESEKTKEPGVLYKSLKKKIPLIEEATLAYPSKERVVIKLRLQQPHFAINKDYVLTDDGTVAVSSLLNKDVVGRLPQINVDRCQNTRSCVPGEFCSCMDSVPGGVFEDYEVKWEDQTKIELRDKHDPRFVVVTSCGTPISQQLLETCQKIKKMELSENKYKYRKKDHRLVADVRFDRQIIFFAEKEGQ